MTVFLTPGGLRRHRERLAAVRAEFDAVVADNPEARESGDSSVWHDNFAFEENQRRMHQLAHRVREIERLIDRARLVAPLVEAPDAVVVGATVVWRFDDEAEHALRETWIAGFEDGDPAEGRVSYESPIGRALLGAAEGELREITLGGRRRWVEIIELGPTPPGEGPEADDDVREAAWAAG